MKTRKYETIEVTWTRLGRKLQREFNSRRRADEFALELINIARKSASFGSRITIESKTQFLLEAER